MSLTFKVTGARATPHVAAPHLSLLLRVGVGELAVRSLSLQVQLRIDPARRAYGPRAAERLTDLFGARERWGETLRSLLWTNLAWTVPGFAGEAALELQVPCTFDFNVAATRYFAALDEGLVPLVLLFSGTVFHAGPGGALQVTPIPREAEASFELPVAVWQEVMDRHYGDTAFLPVRRDLLERLAAYRSGCAAPTWERALEDLLGGRT